MNATGMSSSTDAAMLTVTIHAGTGPPTRLEAPVQLAKKTQAQKPSFAKAGERSGRPPMSGMKK